MKGRNLSVLANIRRYDGRATRETAAPPKTCGGCGRRAEHWRLQRGRDAPGLLCVVLAGVMTDAERRDLNEALEQPEFRELVARASGDLHETRAFMAGLRDHFGRWLAQLWAVEREVIATYGDASERYSDAGFHQFAALRMGIHAIGAKVTWCNETLGLQVHGFAIGSALTGRKRRPAWS